MQSLIIAAGQGSRIASVSSCKPLTIVAGLPLLEHVLVNSIAGGISEFIIVTGCQADRIETFVRKFSERSDILIRTVYNPDWHQSNGLSVLAARDIMDDFFLLQMADHIIAPELINSISRRKPRPDQLILAVDYRLNNPHIDLDDVTRVKVKNGRIVSIGKHLNDYNAYDTGLFHCSANLFSALDLSITINQDASLSGGVRVLAKSGLAATFDCGDNFWIDVDSPQDYYHACSLISAQANRSN